MNLLALETGPKRLQDALLSRKARLPQVSLSFARSPADHRSREVPKITAVRIAREDVQNDQLVCGERAFPALVWVASHLTASNNRVASRFSSHAHHGKFHFNAKEFGRQDPPSPSQCAILGSLGGSQNFMTARHTRLRYAKGLFHSLEFLRRLELALRPKGPFRSLNANPLALQTRGKPKRKIPGRQDMFDAAPLQEFADYRCESRFLLLSALKFLFQLREAGDLVDSGLAAATIELEIAKQQGSSTAGLEKDKGIRHPESCGVEHVRRSFAGSNNESCRFHRN
jgi:hypothetical protein